MPCRMAARRKGCRPCRSSSRRPALRGGQSGALAIQADVVLLGRDAQRRQVQAANAPEHARRDMPGHAVVAEIGQRVAQRGQLPVQHGNDAGLGGVEHQVVQAEVAMHDGHAVLVPCARGHVGGQPGHELVHFRDGLRDRGQVLLAPAADLALEVVAGLAVAGKTRSANFTVCSAEMTRLLSL